MSKPKRALALAAALTVAGAAPAAARWGGFGDDPGHSSNQPVEVLNTPLLAAHATTTGAATGAVTSAGAAGTRVMAYGTTTGKLVVRKLDDGSLVSADAGAAIVATPDPAADTFGLATAGTGNPAAGVTPLDASSATGPGNILAIVNHQNTGLGAGDIELARVKASTGAPTGTNTPLDNTDTYTVNSSPVITEPDASDTRVIYFVAKAADGILGPVLTPGAATLFRVQVSKASTDATVTAVTKQNITGANLAASPTLVTLKDASGAATQYVAVSANSGAYVQTYLATDITMAAPKSPTIAGGDRTGTIATPLNADGTVAAATGDLYVTVSDSTTAKTTKVVRLTQSGSSQTLTESDTSGALPGVASPGIAVTDDAATAGIAGSVVVTTDKNLYVLDASKLTTAAKKLSATDLTGTAGFTHTVPATSGALVVAERDNGAPVVAKLTDAQAVTSADFTAATAQAAGTASFGQPAIDHGLAVFTNDKGEFAYKGPSATLNIADVSAAEGSTGTATTFSFTITKAGTGPASAKVSTADGTAKAGEDYTAVTGQAVTFTDAETTKVVTVTVKPDTTVEPDETFTLNLSDAGPNTKLGTNGTGTIKDDDAPGAGGGTSLPVINVADASAAEGNGTGNRLVFPVTLSKPATATVTATFVVGNGTARYPTDYTTANGTVTIPVGQTAGAAVVQLVGDTIPEANETLAIALTQITNATGTGGRIFGVGTIIDDETAYLSPGSTKSTKKKSKVGSMKATPKRDKAKPYKFKVSGKVTGGKCTPGKVTLTLKAGSKSVAKSKKVTLKSTCKFSATITAKSTTKKGKLKLKAAFGGSTALKSSSKTLTVQAG